MAHHVETMEPSTSVLMPLHPPPTNNLRPIAPAMGNSAFTTLQHSSQTECLLGVFLENVRYLDIVA
jgi:hypothetical protein